ncbi:M15 family metallopeptidase [Paenibacillus sp. KN14-4R]|uniref:M15 family metallopeptidase n=1 Tax=Paenibacillus sp. KN14-4R TaxID=3445773 RepID=UPI003F9FF950
MKKWFFLLVVLFLVLGYQAFQLQQKIENKGQGKEDYTTIEKSSQSNDRTIKVEKDQIYEGNLILVNKNFPVHQAGIKSDVVDLIHNKNLLTGYGLLDNSIKLSKSVAQVFSTMIQDAGKEGVNHFLISSGYRDSKEQSKLYQTMGADYAMPAGYSEHNVGLSLDIGSSQKKMSQAPEGKWLTKNAWTYGFILRYPEDKTDITGIQHEPWHFRYVGLPHSMIMRQKNLSLEEYLDFLKEQKTISSTVGGKKYEIAYHRITSNTTIQVPSKGQIEISGNNMDGVIVTVAL